MIKPNKKLQNAELDLIKAKISEINQPWIRKPSNINLLLNILIVVGGGLSIFFLSRITDIKKETLVLERANLLHEINIFKTEKDSLYDSSGPLKDSIDILQIYYHKYLAC